MKNFILKTGRFLIDFNTFIQPLILIILSILIGENAQNFFVGILSFLILFIIFIFSNYTLYLLIGIHDCQISISKNLEAIIKNSANNTDVNN